MRTDFLDFELPDRLIAQEPLARRSDSRLLYLNRSTGEINHLRFDDLPSLMNPGDLLVTNNTRVTALRLYGEKSTGAKVEFLLLQELEPGVFEALVKPGKRLGVGARASIEGLIVEVIGLAEEGKRVLRISGNEWRARLSHVGSVPLPPYITAKLKNPERYQTVYSSQAGSAAAPTAGLHFTPELLGEMKQKGVDQAFVTLDVSLDTFRPVSVDNLEDHKMHGEVCRISSKTQEAVSACKGRVIAVGTTSVRTLESFATGPKQVEIGEKSTKLFILPGYRFKVVDGIITNFHMPRTTMLAMLSAFTQPEYLKAAYQEALAMEYRFLSFGDAMMIL